MNHPQQSWNDSEALVESYLTLVTTNNPKGSPKPGAETSALHDAVLQGDIQFLEGLIRSGVDVNAEVEGFTVCLTCLMIRCRCYFSVMICPVTSRLSTLRPKTGTTTP